MRSALVDLLLQMRLFLVYELRKFRRVVADSEGMRKGKRELLLRRSRLALLLLRRFQLGAH